MHLRGSFLPLIERFFTLCDYFPQRLASHSVCFLSFCKSEWNELVIIIYSSKADIEKQYVTQCVYVKAKVSHKMEAD